MKTIRNQLLCWLLSGVAILLVAAGTCVFFTVRYVLLDRVEALHDQLGRVLDVALLLAILAYLLTRWR